MIHTEEVAYRDDETVCKGFFAFDNARQDPLPTVLISHMIGGRESFDESKAEALAQLGFAAFAFLGRLLPRAAHLRREKLSDFRRARAQSECPRRYQKVPFADRYG